MGSLSATKARKTAEEVSITLEGRRRMLVVAGTTEQERANADPDEISELLRVRGRQMCPIRNSLFRSKTSDFECNTATDRAPDVGEPVGHDGVNVPGDIVASIDRYTRMHERYLPRQKRYALENLCLLAKAGVDVSLPSAGDDTLHTRFDGVLQRVNPDDIRSNSDARRALAQFRQDMNLEGVPVDERQSAVVKATKDITPILAVSLVYWRLKNVNCVRS